MELADSNQLVSLDYTNHRGERATRLILPSRIYFGATAWHPEPQWLLVALDVEKLARRDFALSALPGWEPAPVPIPKEA